jgi:alpha-tubulin suppressor-like RCC1 family protein
MVMVMVMSFASAVLLSSSARAHSKGIVAQGCTGCHSGGKSPLVGLSLDPPVFDPGSSVTATITVQAINGSVGGMYISASTGKFSLISGQSTSLVSDTEVTQSTPKAATGGNVVFQTHWLAPSSPGGVIFDVWALSANGNGSASGDGGGSVSLNAPFGCPGTPYYIDLDGDGYAGTEPTVFVSCAPQAGFSAKRGDCNDDDRNIYPAAPERCNQLDDNCNGTVDEGLQTGAIVLWPDSDGDGYGTSKGTTKVGQGCVAVPGYAVVAGDCNDRDASVHPNAPDICNLVDDDCNGQVDDTSRPVCGVGACQARSPSCNAQDCVPRPPIAEVCNAADDDCDGVVDNGDTHCQAGATCRSGICVVGEVSGVSALAGGASFGGASAEDASFGGVSSRGESAGSVASGSSDSAAPSAGCALAGRPGSKSAERKLWLASVLLAGAVLRRRKQRALLSERVGLAPALATPWLLATVLATTSACGAQPSAGRGGPAVPQTQALNTIAAGAGHTCTVTKESRVYCWGSDVDGQLGDGRQAESAVPKRVLGLTAVSLSAGSYHSCALDTAANARCWGWNVAGQVGDGTNQNRLSPFLLAQLPGSVGVVAGGYHSCGLLPDGSARCWGQNDEGQLGSGSTRGSLQPVSVFSLPGARALAATGRHTCALVDDGTVQCWGSNDSGELGDGTPLGQGCAADAPCYRALPAPVLNVNNATAIATGFHHSCVLLADQSVSCFGSNQYGELGNGTNLDSSVPVSVVGLPPAVAIAAGYNHSCALVAGGLVYCWGWNAGGQLGDGTRLDKSQPTAVSGLSEAAAIAGGGFHSCAQTRTGSVLCWGSNDSGQLGDGSTVDHALPALVGPFLD